MIVGQLLEQSTPTFWLNTSIHPPHLARGNPPQKGLPDQFAHFLRTPLQPSDPTRQKRALPRARNAQANHPQRRHIVPLVKAIAIVQPLSRRDSLMPPQSQVIGHPLLGRRSPATSSAPFVSVPGNRPKSFPAGSAQTLETVLCYSSLASGCRLLYRRFCCGHNKTYTLSLFTHSKLRHPDRR